MPTESLNRKLFFGILTGHLPNGILMYYSKNARLKIYITLFWIFRLNELSAAIETAREKAGRDGVHVPSKINFV